MSSVAFVIPAVTFDIEVPTTCDLLILAQTLPVYHGALRLPERPQVSSFLAIFSDTVANFSVIVPRDAGVSGVPIRWEGEKALKFVYFLGTWRVSVVPMPASGTTLAPPSQVEVVDGLLRLSWGDTSFGLGLL